MGGKGKKTQKMRAKQQKERTKSEKEKERERKGGREIRSRKGDGQTPIKEAERDGGTDEEMDEERRREKKLRYVEKRT